MPAPRLALLASLALVSACAADGVVAPAPLSLELGAGFTGAITGDARLVVASRDGRVLLDGLAPGPIADGAPPLVGFAVRDIDTTYEMQLGSFKPTSTPRGPWRAATRLARAGEGALDLVDAAGAALAHLRFTSPDDGHLVAAITPGDGPERRFSWGFACDDADHFAGFGAQSLDVDHKGFTVPTLVQEQGIGKSELDSYAGDWFLTGTRHASQAPIPQYLARRGYILTANTERRAIFALCSEGDKKAVRVEVDLPVEVHLFDGPAPAQAIARATRAFGRPRLPPRVAFAPWLDAIFGSANVRAVAKKLRDEGVPSSVIWTEDWRGGFQSGDSYKLKEEWDVDTTLYPDMPALTGDLHAAGFDFFVYFSPFIYKDAKAWGETEPQGWLVKHTDGSDYTFLGAKLTDTGLLDLDNPDARAWAVGKMRAAIALGADGWMNDFAEWLPTDGLTAKGPSLERHNVWPVLWQQTAREAIDGVKDGQDRLFFARSGWFGTPQLADVFWAGDQRTDFERDDGLPTILPIGIGLGLVGISTYGHDIAGYQSATNPASTKELFFRWTALGAFSPVMRTHHGSAPTLDWSWQKDAETIAHFRRYAKLHIALVPFLEGLARVAADTGLPMWRGLMIPFPDDASVWPIVDEVMLGDGVLLAPVMTMGATSRPVYLPAGTWFPWSGGAALPGGATMTAPAPLGEIPVFVRGGTVIPAFPDGVMTLAHGSAAVPDAASVGDDRVVTAFLGGDGGFAEASGLGYDLRKLGEGAGAITLAWQGAALAACGATPAAPCFEAGADGATAHVTGPGALEVSLGGALAARVTASGGAGSRRLTIVVRR